MVESSQSEAVLFGKYLLDREIARGGMSRVYRARLRGPGGFEKKLVVKQILPELSRDPSFVELFVKEANTLVQMSHPGLVPVYELGVVDGVYFLAMERIEGATISEMLRDGPLPEALVAQIGAEIAEALRYAHERFQIVHRDVTTRNVIVDSAGHARLLDFGIAAPVELTGQGELFGSPGYMAPEQLRGEALGSESDLFSLGAVLYEAACGKPALSRITSSTQLPYPAVPALDQLHPTLRALIAGALSEARAARPSSAAEVATTLRTWLAEHHPGGVERELAARAQSAHDAREAPQTSVRAEHGTDHQSGPKSGPVQVRSIATSPVLEELLKQATERIERVERIERIVPVPAHAPPSDDLMADPEAQVTFKRFMRDIVVITLALAAAIFWARYRPLNHDSDSAQDTTAAEASRVMAPTAPSVPTLSAMPPIAAANAPAPTEAASATSPLPQEATDPSKQALLTVNALPWAEVRLDGRPLGVTPRRKLPVHAGKHVLLLQCPALGKEAKVPIQAREGQALQVLVDLQSDPPTVSVR